MSEVTTEENLSNIHYLFNVNVKFEHSSKVYTFGTDDEDIHMNDHVVVETARGIEMGEVAAEPVKAVESLNAVIKPILRKADEQDMERAQRNKEDREPAIIKCKEFIRELDLPMTLIDAEYSLDRSKLAFTYVAEERVDFRQLLRKLAAQFHTRIDLRQIGPRDKARMVGGLGICGMPLCCNRFQRDFGVISINMAKNQLLALNPDKLSGQCGKLMCCLAFENEDYKELRQGLPKMNATVIYNDHRYRVTSMNVLVNQARLSSPDGFVDISIDELKQVVAYNKEHNITAQSFIAEQKEKEATMPPKPEKKKTGMAKYGVSHRPSADKISSVAAHVISDEPLPPEAAVDADFGELAREESAETVAENTRRPGFRSGLNRSANRSQRPTRSQRSENNEKRGERETRNERRSASSQRANTSNRPKGKGKTGENSRRSSAGKPVAPRPQRPTRNGPAGAPRPVKKETPDKKEEA